MKSVLNVGEVVTAAGLGALAFTLLHGAQAPIGYAKVGAALVGAACYFVVNTGAMVTIMATFGTPWHRTISGGIKGKLLVTWGGVAIAIPPRCCWPMSPCTCPWPSCPSRAALLGTGHFYARHDRTRLRGLFEATLDVNRSMGTEETKAAVLAAAGSLLRSPKAR